MIIIDNREHKLIELIKNTSSFIIPYEIQNLQIGDIIIKPSNHPEHSLIIERKCMPDMISSIKDGRYKEQKLRLQAETNNTNSIICYLLEGLITDLRKPTDKTLLYGSIISSIFRDTIPVIRTTSLQETLDILVRLHERMTKNINDFFSLKNKNTTEKLIIDTGTNSIVEHTNSSIENTIENSSISSNSSSNSSIINTINTNTTILDTSNNLNDNNLYLQSIKKCKKENMTPKMWNQLILTNIPGVSTLIAIKINEVYPTITSLLKAYTTCETDNNRIELLSTIILTHTEKQKRHIGKVISKRIHDYLYLDN